MQWLLPSVGRQVEASTCKVKEPFAPEIVLESSRRFSRLGFHRELELGRELDLAFIFTLGAILIVGFVREPIVE